MEKVLDLLNFMAVLILSTACHEFAHAKLADRFGDDTPRLHGRISWNPLVHIHPIYTVALPAVLYWTSGAFMAAAFTPVNPARMRHPRVHGLLTSLGGPATNLLLSATCFLVLAVYILAIGGIRADTPAKHLNIADILFMAVQLNVFLAIFNFLPVPPLDGGDLVGFLLPARLRGRWEDFRRVSWILFLVLMATGVLEKVLGPPMAAAAAVVKAGIHVVNGIALG